MGRVGAHGTPAQGAEGGCHQRGEHLASYITVFSVCTSLILKEAGGGGGPSKGVIGTCRSTRTFAHQLYIERLEPAGVPQLMLSCLCTLDIWQLDLWRARSALVQPARHVML